MFDRVAKGPAGLAIGAFAASSCSEHAGEPFATAAGERNSALVSAIREAGYLCDEVLATNSTETPVRMWRVVCDDLLVYMAMLDDDDALHIEPMPYVDPQASRISITRLPDVGAGMQR
jgi:hypothetical protein